MSLLQMCHGVQHAVRLPRLSGGVHLYAEWWAFRAPCRASCMPATMTREALGRGIMQ